MNGEIWLPVESFEGKYEISNMGRVKSLGREVDYRYQKVFRKERILRLAIDSDGYYVVGLYKNAVGGNKRVNRLVALHFIPNPQNLPVVNHKKGNKLDNRASELEWSSYSENTQHAYDSGLIKAPKGSKCGASKFKESDIIEIRRLASAGIMHKAIAGLFPMSKRNLHNIINRKSWTHI